MYTSYSIVGRSPNRTLSVTYSSDGDIATIPESHEAFGQLIKLLVAEAPEDEIRGLVDIFLGASKKLTALSERVSVRGNRLLFDGDPINGTLVEYILELHAHGESEKLGAYVNFLEKVKTNPAIETIDGLWKWIQHGDLTVTPEGDVLFYKGCIGNGDARTSSSQGTAFVDGEEITGKIPNPDGAVVTMPRSTVDDGGWSMCSTGLHVATYAFASGFAREHGNGGGDVVVVKVNPRDVVSVPNDSSFQKLRVCRYTVLHAVEDRLNTRVYEQLSLDEAEPEALWNQSTLGDEEDVAGDPEQEEWDEYGNADEPEDVLDELEEDGTLDRIDNGVEPEEAEQPRKLTVDELAEALGLNEAEKPSEEPQGPLRDSSGRFTKSGALKEALASKRDALGRFIKKG